MNHLKDLQPDTRNPRLHPERNVRAIVKSLEEVGAARSIVIDENNQILCGNGLVDAAGIAGIENIQIVAVPQDRKLATWEPSWERPPVYRPDLVMLGAGLEGFTVKRERQDDGTTPQRN